VGSAQDCKFVNIIEYFAIIKVNVLHELALVLTEHMPV